MAFLKQSRKARPHVAQTRSLKQERELARKVGGTVTPGSGNQSVKGDVRLKGVVRIECKTTARKSFALTRDMLRKIEEAGLGFDEVPAMEIEFVDNRGQREIAVAVVPVYFLEMLTKYVAAKKSQGPRA